MSLPRPFPLRPVPPAGGACPRDGGSLTIERLHFPGARFLLTGHCAACGHRYLQDLPNGHAIVYPSSLDLDTGEAHGQWFETELREGYLRPDTEPVDLDVESRGSLSGRPALLNCLEPVYGHALLRLLNAQRLRQEDPDGSLIVLAPRALAPLIPSDADERWLVDAPLGRFRGWLAQLDERIATELARFDACTLALGFPHPHPGTFDLRHFTGPLEPEAVGEPSVVLSLRDDRLWGRSLRDQRRRFGRLAQMLTAALPAAGVAAIGVVPAGAAPEGCEDRTAARPDDAIERRWLALLAGADLAIGVHGSNMLLPSGLARATVELLPEDRFGNLTQATLATDPDVLATLYRHRTLYGAQDLRDITPERAAAVALAALVGGRHYRARHIGPLAGQPEGMARPDEPAFGDAPASRWQRPPAPWAPDRAGGAGGPG